MTGLRRARRSACMVVALLLTGTGYCAQVAVSPARSPATQTECLGYYTVGLPGEFEYALMSNFSQGLGAWSSEIRLNLRGLESQELSISQSAGLTDLEGQRVSMNLKRTQEIDELKSNLAETDRPSLRKIYSDQLADLHLFLPIAGHNAIGRLDKEKLALRALVNGHILTTEMKPQGTPAQTLDVFLSHYRPRALGEVPTGPGVCVPFGFFTGEQQPASIGLNIRLKDQPDIVIFLLARDAATNEPDDPRKLFDGLTPASTFFGSKNVTPIHRIKPLQPITIDGNEGLGSFVRVKRKLVIDQSRAFNNAAENDEDWGYFAYVPGLTGGKPGESLNLEFKVERFGRFASSPMSESEFRALTLRIAASIKRRPGAWVSH